MTDKSIHRILNSVLLGCLAVSVAASILIVVFSRYLAQFPTESF